MNFKTLKNKQRKERHKFPDYLSLRVHRAISWGLRAEQETDDIDVIFLLLWVGFNAVYASDSDTRGDEEKGSRERKAFKAYLGILADLDDGSLYDAVWNERFLAKNSLLVEDKYLHQTYWKFLAGKTGKSWEDELRKDENTFNSAKAYRGIRSKRVTANVLFIIFCRLYILRNQLLHGSATWKSGLNRKAVRRGANIMQRMLPIFVNIMMDNPAVEWGTPCYLPTEQYKDKDKPTRQLSVQKEPDE